ncbi:MAG: DUF3489 domain-containing protein [Pseudooceanicola sp.]
MTQQSQDTASTAAADEARPARATRPARTTKKAQLVRMLSGKRGADLATISATLGWQSHTTRAALTGLKKAGYDLTADKPDARKPARYRIVAAPGPTKAGQAGEASDAG